jgi:hypothetical protein
VRQLAAWPRNPILNLYQNRYFTLRFAHRTPFESQLLTAVALMGFLTRRTGGSYLPVPRGLLTT